MDSRVIRMRGRVGSKGELFIPKAIREILDLNPGDEVEYIVKGYELIVRKVPRVVDALKNAELRVKMSIDEFEDMSWEVLGL